MKQSPDLGNLHLLVHYQENYYKDWLFVLGSYVAITVIAVLLCVVASSVVVS